MGDIGLRLEIILWDVFRNNYGIYLQKQWDIYNFIQNISHHKTYSLSLIFWLMYPLFFP